MNKNMNIKRLYKKFSDLTFAVKTGFVDETKLILQNLFENFLLFSYM